MPVPQYSIGIVGIGEIRTGLEYAVAESYNNRHSYKIKNTCNYS